MKQPDSKFNFKSIRFQLPLLFMMTSAIPALVAIIWISSLLTDRMEQMLQQRVRDSAQIADNVFKQYGEDLLLKTRVVSENRQISALLLSGDKIALINQLSALQQDLNLSVYGASIEVFDQSAGLVVSEPKRVNQQVPSPTVYTVLKRGEFKTSVYFLKEQLTVSAALPLFHPRQATPVGAVALSYPVSHKLADEIRKIAGAEVLFFVRPLGSPPRILATTLDESSSEDLVKKHANDSLHLRDQPEYLLAALKGS
ncbi:MAG: hypothetical protein CVV27_16150, partial [Candidatus Melainabacteria bacterium HGW-Melainabacteria-1]